MSEFKEFAAVPELTLEPFKEENEKRMPVPEKPQETWDDSVLSEEEKRQVEAFAEQIDLTDSSVILQYGAGTQKKMADFSESALENVKTKQLSDAAYGSGDLHDSYARRIRGSAKVDG